MVYVIKIGGSLIAPYDKAEADLYRIDRIIESISEVSDIILVHGAGGYAHPIAKKMMASSNKKMYASWIWRNMQVLNTLVISIMRNYGMNPKTVHYQDFLNVEDFLSSVYDSYTKGFIPVSYGTLDINLNIVSGDVLVELISKYISNRVEYTKVIYVTDVDGVYDPITKKHISFMDLDDLSKIIKDIDEHTTKSVDVTGGMKGKLLSIKRILDESDVKEVYIVNGKYPERIKNILSGLKTVCTKIVGDKFSFG